MTEIIKYSLKDFQNITFNGFNYELPSYTIDMISELTLKVGSPSYIKTPIFQKKHNIQSNLDFDNKDPIKKKKNKNNDSIGDSNWESLRTFQTTKIEQKVGIDAQIDAIRLHINKLTDKNYIDMRNKIMEIIDNLMKDNNNNNDDINKVSIIIFDIATNNRFYSKNYADLYSDLISNFEPMKKVFEDNFNQFINLFHSIEYVDPGVDYDKFCKINKDNEKRKSLSSFFVNLMKNKIISRDKIIGLIEYLFKKLLEYVKEDNRKNEVDEITENISILYCKELFCDIGENDYNIDIEGLNISDTINRLATSKTKDYKSLTNKAIFKYMDMIDM